MAQQDSQPDSADPLSVVFATSVMDRLFAPGSPFHTYEQIHQAGGPSPTSLVRLRKAQLGTVTLQRPRPALFRSLDNALAQAAGDDVEPGRAERLWDDALTTVHGANPEDEYAGMSAGPEAHFARQESDQETEQLRAEVTRLRAENRRLRAAVVALTGE